MEKFYETSWKASNQTYSQPNFNLEPNFTSENINAKEVSVAESDQSREDLVNAYKDARRKMNAGREVYFIDFSGFFFFFQLV